MNRDRNYELDAEEGYVELMRATLARERGVDHVADPDDPDGPTYSARAVAFEITRWQERIDKVVAKIFPARDGSGCDSGDPLDLTETEIKQAFNHLTEQIEKATADLARVTAERETETTTLRLCVENMFIHVMRNSKNLPDHAVRIATMAGCDPEVIRTEAAALAAADQPAGKSG